MNGYSFTLTATTDVILRHRDNALPEQLVVDITLQLQGATTWDDLGLLAVDDDHVAASDRHRRADTRNASVRLTVGSTLYHLVDVRITYDATLKQERIRGVTPKLPVPAPNAKGLRETELKTIVLTVVFPTTRTVPAATSVSFVDSFLWARYTQHTSDPVSLAVPDMALKDIVPPTISTLNMAAGRTLAAWAERFSSPPRVTLPTELNSNYGNMSLTNWQPEVTPSTDVLATTFSPDLVTYPFPLGNTTVTVTSQDKSLNQAQQNFTVIVSDVEAPRLWCAIFVDGQLQTTREPCRTDTVQQVTKTLGPNTDSIRVENAEVAPVHVCDNACAEVCSDDQPVATGCGTASVTQNLLANRDIAFNNNVPILFTVCLCWDLGCVEQAVLGARKMISRRPTSLSHVVALDHRHG